MPIYGVTELNDTLDVLVTAADIYDPLVSATHTATKNISFYSVVDNVKQWKSLADIKVEMGIGPVGGTATQDITPVAGGGNISLTNFLLNDITQELYSKQSWADATSSVSDHLTTLQTKTDDFTSDMYDKLKDGFVLNDLVVGDGFGYIATRTITTESTEETSVPTERTLAVMFLQAS